MKKVSLKSPTILDCTLRDGGYYTNWDFDSELVDAYLKAVDNAKIPYVEIGLRMPPKDKYLGAFAHSTDSFLDSLPPLSFSKLGVMINATDYLDSNYIDKYFKKASSCRVEFVRIATHLKDLKSCQEMVSKLISLGYFVGLNLMQVSTKEDIEVTNAIKEINEWNEKPEVLYFADSLGGMNQKDISAMVSLFKESWSGDIGIHAHNNCARALTNSLQAIEDGVTWADSTMLGMGRGAGNTETEYLLQEISRRFDSNVVPEAVLPVVLEQFEPLKSIHKWGANALYFLSAKNNIHPTFTQELLNSNIYDHSQILKILNTLKNESATSFSHNLISSALEKNQGTGEGEWSAKDFFAGKKVLLLANGPSVREHKEIIKRLIKEMKPVVISLNINKHIEHDFIDYTAVCTETRLLVEYQKYKETGIDLILPKNQIPEYILNEISDLPIKDFGIRVEPSKFQANESGCIIPFSLVAPYVLALSISSGADEILLAGFDGYKTMNKKQIEMETVFRELKKNYPENRVISITPTNYPVKSKSIYSYELGK